MVEDSDVEAGLPASTAESEWDELPPGTWSQLDRLARALRVAGSDLDTTLDAVVRTAVETITAARHVGLILVRGQHLEPRAASDDVPWRLDVLQNQSGEGPCFDAARTQTPILLQDTEKEERWPTFTAAAREAGVRSVACCPLFVDDLQLGALSLYSDEPDAFDAQALSLAALFATHAALALAEAQRIDQLREAVESRDVIGQAKGILMERHRISADEAFSLLVKASQRANRKLIQIAGELARTGSRAGAAPS